MTAKAHRTILVVGPAPELTEPNHYRLIGPFSDDLAAQDWLAANPRQQVDVALLHGSENGYSALISMLQRHNVTTVLFPGR